ncbi:hypothetical protein HQ590_14795 [bacterium]|nr:hypothetical protein [bacterium]
MKMHLSFGRPLAAAVLLSGGLVLVASCGRAAFVTLPEDLLLGSEFSSSAWGPATLSRSDLPGPAVRFALDGLTAASTGIKDDYPVSDIGQVIPSHGSGDFSIFDRYELTIRNVNGTGSTWVSLVLNTGFTGPSGVPSNDPTNDTFWQSPWTELVAGQTATLVLDFADAVPYSISDNQNPHTHGGASWPDGVSTAINGWDRAEVSAIGFQVADFSGSGSQATLEIQPAVVPEPANLVVWGLLLVFLAGRGRSASGGRGTESPGKVS